MINMNSGVILDCLYVMGKMPNSKSVQRYDCIFSTGDCLLFEEIAANTKEKRTKFYCGNTPECFSRATSKIAITHGRYNISSVFFPDPLHPNMGYGDIKGTNDALFFIFSDDGMAMWVLVAKGMKRHRLELFERLVSGGLDGDTAKLVKRLKPTSATEAFSIARDTNPLISPCFRG